MRAFDWIVLAILLCLIVFGGMTIVSYIPVGDYEYSQYTGNISLLPKVGAVQFYPNMRYKSNEITYSIADICKIEKVIAIKKALDIISNNTVLEFKRVNSSGQIVYFCSQIAPPSEQKGHFVAGEGGPTNIINTTTFSLILSGQVSLYREEKCESPNVAIHETFHALGFDHVSNKTDIMFPITDCAKDISSALIASINKIYEYPTLPDLGIGQLNVSHNGRFLNFEISIHNHGLNDAQNVNLSVIVDSKEIKSFSLENIPIGSKKILNVQNMIVSKTSKNIIFKVKSYDSQDDLFINDNSAEIYL